MKLNRLLTATAAIALLTSAASAATVTIETVSSQWLNVTGGNGGHVIDNDDPTSSVRWPQAGSRQSGYDFTRVDVPFSPTAGTPFQFGTFTHINKIVPSGSGIDSVDLRLQAFGSIGSLSAPVAVTLRFDHWETPNSGSIADCPELIAPHATACDDLVTVSVLGDPEETFTIGGKRYTVRLLGFSTDDGFTTSHMLQSPENGSTTAGLWAEYTIAPIPLPAAGWLLLGGLGAFGVAARRRRKIA